MDRITFNETTPIVNGSNALWAISGATPTKILVRRDYRGYAKIQVPNITANAAAVGVWLLITDKDATAVAALMGTGKGIFVPVGGEFTMSANELSPCAVWALAYNSANAVTLCGVEAGQG